MDDGKPTVNMEEEAKSENCCICCEALNEVNHVKEMPHCKHMFHAHCIDTWLARKVSCPLCRRFAMLPAENALDYLLGIWEISGINIPITVPEYDDDDDDDGPYVSIDDLFMEDRETDDVIHPHTHTRSRRLSFDRRLEQEEDMDSISSDDDN